MPFQRKRARLELTPEIRTELTSLSRSRVESVQKVERAEILLAYADGDFADVAAVLKKMLDLNNRQLAPQREVA